MEVEKYSIKPDETIIDSFWKNYSSKEESTKVRNRIDWLLKNYLHKIAIGDSGWSALYLDTHDNRLWELTFVNSYWDYYPLLKIIDKDTALCKDKQF